VSEPGGKKGIAHWWDIISHHPMWAALIAALLAAAIIAHSGNVFSNSSPTSQPTDHPATSGHPLRVVFQPVASELFSIAFDHDIGVPKASEGWLALHARGGIDVGVSDFRLTLADQSGVPLTVTNIEAVVRRARPAPDKSLAYVYTQGAGTLEGFAVELGSEMENATALVHRYGEQSPTNGPVGNVITETAPFFRNHTITLAPHEIYEAKLEVTTSHQNELEYDFVLSGNTSNHHIVYRTGYFRISGWGQGFSHYPNRYFTLPPHPGNCWARVTKSFAPRCP
jgi:hypothetical protein